MALRIFVGYDEREAVAYHAFCQSVIESASLPVSFHPLHKGMLNFDGQRDGTNAFTFSRYLVPYLCDFKGQALFVDGDMIVTRDVCELFGADDHAISVVKHDYQTKHKRKYIGSALENSNEDYPRKNWSSVIRWNCAHSANAILTPEFIAQATPKQLHRFEWLKDDEIGEFPIGWNHLVGEYPPGPANLYHYTLGVSGFKHYVDMHSSWHWHRSLLNSLQCGGENPIEMIRRAVERVGEL